MFSRSHPALAAAVALVAQLAVTSVDAQPPTAAEPDGVLVLPGVDRNEIRRQDEERVARGEVPHYAVALDADVDPWRHGGWELETRGIARWRLRVRSPGARSLNLAFDRYRMPPGGTLRLAAADRRHHPLSFTHRDNEAHGELWTPPILSDELLLEVRVPVDRLDELELHLATAQHGYAGFGEPEPKSGDCNVNVACQDGEGWSEVARAVGLVSIEGVRFCTGFLVNNTALDGRPFFLTANHCGITRANAASVVVMWNHQSPTCAASEVEAAVEVPGAFQTGAVLRAVVRRTDLTLLELDDVPDPAFDVFYAGWDRRPLAPGSTVTIHHPNTDMKKIAFDFDQTTVTPHLRDEAADWGAHLRIGGWEVGTTEGGSSGAPLFNQDRRVVGQLRGGYAACGNRRADWFGRLAEAWIGSGRPDARISNWLDPLASDAQVLDGLDGAAFLDATYGDTTDTESSPAVR